MLPCVSSPFFFIAEEYTCINISWLVYSFTVEYWGVSCLGSLVNQSYEYLCTHFMLMYLIFTGKYVERIGHRLIFHRMKWADFILLSVYSWAIHMVFVTCQHFFFFLKKVNYLNLHWIIEFFLDSRYKSFVKHLSNLGFSFSFS